MWKPIAGNTIVEEGKKYRLTLQIKLAYKEQNVKMVKNAILNAEKWIHALPDAMEGKFALMNITNVECEPASDRYFLTYVEIVTKKSSNRRLLTTDNFDSQPEFFPVVLAMPEILALGGAIVAVIGVATLGFVAVTKAFEEHVLEPVTKGSGLLLVGIVAYVLLKMRG